MSHFFEVLNRNSESAWIYLSAFALSLFLATIYDLAIVHIKQKNNIFVKLICYVIIAMPVAYVLGNRAVTVGYDTYNYMRGYLYEGNDLLKSIQSGLEPGFVLYRWITYRISRGNCAVFLGGMELLTIVGVLYGIDLSKHGVTFFLFMFYMFFGLKTAGQSRQFLAMAIVFIAFQKYQEGKRRQFIAIVIIAGMFHWSTFFLFLFPFIMKLGGKKNGTVVKYAATAYGISCIIPFAIELIVHFIPKYIYILDQSTTSESIGMGGILDVIPIVVPLLLIRSNDVVQERTKYVAWISIPLRMIAYTTYFAMRMFYYPAIISMAYQSIVINSRRPTYNRLLLKSFLVLLFLGYFVIYYVYLDSAGVFPYISAN